jgi:histidinol-phosphate aminotransferase
MTYTKKNIIDLKPYTSARDIHKKGIFLDANESATQWLNIKLDNIDLNRYPESDSLSVREDIANYLLPNFVAKNVFFGSGSDEIIDLLIRAFVETNENIMMMDPSYSVYEVQANINNVGVKKILLNQDFSLNIQDIKNNIKNTKLIFLCNPNNPTGNLVNKDQLLEILEIKSALIIVDEAYIEYAGYNNSYVDLIKDYDNLVVIRTFSKAWGLAGIRAGYAVARENIIVELLKIKDSYNVSTLTQEIIRQALKQTSKLQIEVDRLLQLKNELENSLIEMEIPIIQTQANFVLAKFTKPKDVYEYLVQNGVIVRDRSNLPHLSGIIRISIGTKQQNDLLINLLKNYLKNNEC